MEFELSLHTGTPAASNLWGAPLLGYLLTWSKIYEISADGANYNLNVQADTVQFDVFVPAT